MILCSVKKNKIGGYEYRGRNHNDKAHVEISKPGYITQQAEKEFKSEHQQNQRPNKPDENKKQCTEKPEVF